MAEKRWRANLISDTVDEIEIVNETDQYVDVQSPATGAWSSKVRREAKITAYSRVCKTKQQAWEAIAAYAQEQLAMAESAVARWTRAKAAAESMLEKPADRTSD